MAASAVELVATEYSSDEESGDDESYDGDPETPAPRGHHKPGPSMGRSKRLFGTHHHGSARTWLSSDLSNYEVCLGMSASTVAMVVAWLLFLTVALFKHFDRAWPLAALTLAVLAGLFLSSEGRMQTLLGKLPVPAPGSRFGVISRWTILAVLSLIMVIVIGFQVAAPGPQQIARLQSLSGTVIFIGLCVVCSHSMRTIPWSVVLSAALLQFYLGYFVIHTETGMKFFQSAGDSVSNFLNFSHKGSGFIFGNLSCFAFNVLPTTVFFSAFISSMYYLGVLQVTVRIVALFLKYTIGASLVQSVNAAGNLFLGQTEAPLLIKPFLATASPGDIHCVMVGGFASIAGGVLAAYVGMGVKADQLIGASVMSVPGTLLVANLVCPPGSDSDLKDDDAKDEAEDEDGEQFHFPPPSENNIIEAAGNGAHIAIDLVLNIGAMLIAFISIIAVLNSALGYLGGLVDLPELSFSFICGYAFWPIAWLLGTPYGDCFEVAKLLGTKIFVNEFVAYNDLTAMLKHEGGPLISRRAELVATYALCGFSNFGSIGITLGGLTSLCPQRSRAFAKLVLSSMICGNAVCFLTATFAGILN